MTKECGECGHYNPQYTSQSGDSYSYGQCRYNPPVAVVSKDDFADRETPAIWPEVLDSDCCSRFDRRPWLRDKEGSQ